MDRIGRSRSVAVAAVALACAPLPAVDGSFATDWSAAGAQCGAHSVYCNLTLRSAWNEQVLPIAAACKRELEHPDTSRFRIIVTLGAGGEILDVAESPPTRVGVCLAERVLSVELPAPPVAGFRFRVPFESNP